MVDACDRQAGVSGGEAALIWCPFPSAEDARAVSEQLLDEKLIACANILPHIVSVFAWQGSVQSGSEAAALMKTRADRLEAATQRLSELHPYDAPAIAGWIADQTPSVTQSWLEEALAKGR